MHNKPSHEELEQKVRQLEKKVASLRQEQTFQDLAENSPDAICRINRELRFTYVNKAVANIVGVPASSLIGKTHHDLSLPENICSLCEQKITEVFETPKGLIFELSLPSPTGAIYIQSHLVPEFSERGTVDTVLCVSRDITDFKKTHEALKESEEKYRLLHESMMESFVSVDMQGRIKEFNKAYQTMLGYSHEELLHLTYPDLTPAKWHEFEAKVVEEQIKPRGYSDVYEKEYRKKDGTVFPVELRTFLIRDAADNPSAMWAIVRDITERKQTENQLKDTRELLGELIASSPVVTYRCKPEGHYPVTFISENIRRQLGYDPDDFMKDPHFWVNHIHPEDAPRVLEELSGLFKYGHHTHEYRFLHKDGTYHWMLDKSRVKHDPAGNPLDIIGNWIDITERKHAEEKLLESEERFRSLVESTSDWIWEVDQAGVYTYVSPRIKDLLGYEPEELIGTTPFDLMPPDEAERIGQIFRDIGASKESVESLENLNRHKDGQLVMLETSAIPLLDKSGDLLGYRGIDRDITERKNAEKRLKINEKILNKAQEISHIGSWHLDIQKNIFSWSDETFRIFGRPPQEFGTTYEAFLEMVHPDDREMVDRKYTDAITNNIPYECVHRVVRPDGTVRIVHEKSENIVDESGKIIHSFGMTNDITEQKLAEENRLKLEQRIQRSKKMESLGLMAGGIAHDLNNILSGIVSYPELLLLQLPDNDPLREPIKTIKDSGKRAADVVSDLLTVAKGVATSKKALNLNTIIREYLDSIEHKRLAQNHPGVVFENDLDAELLNISCSSLHMKKTLMNLVLNASEAIEHQGKVTIKTANRYLDEPLKGYEDVEIGEYVLLTVSDTGSGISQDDIEMVFEPFFTKKVLGRSGTGLGLAVVWNTVHDHDGYINVTSSEDGTIFELYFAVTRDEVTTEEEDVSLEDYLGSGERILVVDDEQNQREIACKLLTQMGYAAEAVSSGEEAIQYLEKHAADLIVLDMIMPGMNGRETYERIIQTHPTQKAIIASGFAETEAVKAAQKLGAGKYVKKPYTLEKIGIAVRDELKK